MGKHSRVPKSCSQQPPSSLSTFPGLDCNLCATVTGSTERDTWKYSIICSVGCDGWSFFALICKIQITEFYWVLKEYSKLVIVVMCQGLKRKHGKSWTNIVNQMVILFFSCSALHWMRIDPPFRSDFLISLPVPWRKIDATNVYAITYTWLIAIPWPPSFPLVHGLHNQIWKKHKRKLRINMGKHDDIVSEQNALTYRLYRSACTLP